MSIKTPEEISNMLFEEKIEMITPKRSDLEFRGERVISVGMLRVGDISLEVVQLSNNLRCFTGHMNAPLLPFR